VVAKDFFHRQNIPVLFLVIRKRYVNFIIYLFLFTGLIHCKISWYETFNKELEFFYEAINAASPKKVIDLFAVKWTSLDFFSK
jgi:hypothetical protein